MHINYLEVPFIWMHRRDHLVLNDYSSPQPRALLDRPHLWRIQALSFKFRSVLDRRAAFWRRWQALGISEEEDPYLQDAMETADTVEEIQDLQEWVSATYGARSRELKIAAEEARVAAEEEALATLPDEYDEEGNLLPKKKPDESLRMKLPRESRFDRAKKTIISRLAAVSLSCYKCHHA